MSLNLNIKQKITFSTVFISWFSVFLAIGLIIWQSEKLIEELLIKEAKNRLTSIKYFKSKQVTTYFENLMNNMSSLASNQITALALGDFSKTFPKYLSEAKSLAAGYKSQVINNYIQGFTEQYKYYNVGKTVDAQAMLNLISENSFALQYKYIFDNPYPISNKDQLFAVEDGTKYSLMHARYHKSFLAFKQHFGFYDIFLVDAKTGNIVYTVNKEIDFTTSLLTGPYAKSSIGEVFRKSIAATDGNFISIADFTPYLAYYDNQAAFMGTPIFDDSGNKLGVLIVQLAIDDLNNIMTNQDQWERIGLGKTLTSVIVGPDYKLRSTNRFFLENPNNFLQTLQQSGVDQKTIDLIRVKNSIIGILKTDTKAVHEAFAGKEGFIDYVDYRKIPVLGSFAPLNIPGLNWIIIAKIDQAEALSGVTILKNQILSNAIKIAMLVAIFAVLLGIKTASSIVQSIHKITDGLNEITQTKDLTKRLEVPENSEFSIMIKAFNNFIASVQQNLTTIVNYSNKAQNRVNNNFSGQNNEDEVKQEIKRDIFALTDQISEISKEFKIIEDQNERTKYW